VFHHVTGYSLKCCTFHIFRFPVATTAHSQVAVFNAKEQNMSIAKKKVKYSGNRIWEAVYGEEGTCLYDINRNKLTWYFTMTVCNT
jgi:hypothetical protein